MNKNFSNPLFVALFFSLIAGPAQAEDWIAQSNKHAEEFTRDYSKMVPELGSSLGYNDFDSQGICVINDMETREINLLQKWETKLEAELKKENHPELSIDIEIMLDMVRRGIRGQQLSIKHGEVPIPKLSEDIYKYIQMLVNPQSDQGRRKAAVDRFKSYVNGHNSCKPLVEATIERITFSFARFKNQEMLYPLKESLEKYLKDSPALVGGIKELLAQSGRSDWQSEFKEFEAQIRKYDDYLKEKMLPNARTSYQLPLEMYEYTLLQKGIDAKASELIKIGLEDYRTVYRDFESIAKQVAKKRGLKSTKPATVISALKSEQVTKPEEVKELYAQANRELTSIIEKHNLVTLPKAALKIRLASDAESKAFPVPHLQPPPLVNNKGERPEFVVPTSSAGKLPFDDFSFKAAASVLTAHEGRPGHDLQFSSMLDNGVSIVRARYAFNNVNVEGWGLYAEDLVYPYLSLESQFVALQTRLWRIARTFLDPQIQTGKIQPKRVIDLFTKELGVSKEMAQLEVNRYTFDDPGQAPSYYYGLLKLRSVRNAAMEKLKKGFSLKCFNDAVLSVGMVPVDKVSRRLSSELKCS